MTSYKEALEVMRKVGWTAYDFDSDNIVVVEHEEGTSLKFHSAFIKKWKQFIFIYTEHHGYFVYDVSDLRSYRQYKALDIEPLTNTGYKDTCSLCKKEFDVETLYYKYDEVLYNTHIMCPPCWDKFID